VFLGWRGSCPAGTHRPDDEGISTSSTIRGSAEKFLFMPGGGSLHPASHETWIRSCITSQEALRSSNTRPRMADLACEMLERNGYTTKTCASVPHQPTCDIRACRSGWRGGRKNHGEHRVRNTHGGPYPLFARRVVEGRLKKGFVLRCGRSWISSGGVLFAGY